MDYNIAEERYMSNYIRKIGFFLLIAVFLNLTGCGLVVINYDKLGIDRETTAATTEIPETVGIVTEVTEEITSIVTTEVTEETYIVTTEEKYADIIEDDLAQTPEKDYGNVQFKITTPDKSALAPENDIEFVSEALFERNKLVGEKHSVSIIVSSVEYEVYFEEVSTAVKAGTYHSDLLMLPQKMVGSFATSGLLTNMRSIPGLDLGAEYFNQSSVEAAAGGVYSYALAGHASLQPYTLPAVFFNKNIASELGVDPYALVSSGEWTWEKFFEISSSAASMDGVYSWASSDVGDELYDIVFASTGLKMVNSGLLKTPSLGFDGETTAGVSELLAKLSTDTNALGHSEGSLDSFKDGKGIFLMNKLATIPSLSDCKAQNGILPIPKNSNDDSYATLASPDSLMFACPAGLTTPDKSAVILMSLNAASANVVKDSYIKYLQYNYLRDNDSANMLDQIFESIVYDFSYTFGNIYPEIADATYTTIRESVLPENTIEGLLTYRVAPALRIFEGKFKAPD